jgi:methionyl-tRNA formyltransferase
MGSKKIVYFGMAGLYSAVPLNALLESGHAVVGIVFPRPATDNKPPRWIQPSRSPVKDLLLAPTRPSILSLAADRGIPVLEIGSFSHPDALAAFESIQPELGVAACFPWLLPERWLVVPEMGVLNLHPSLLPAYRGPQPLFWQFRAGEQRSGVTLHFMDAGADTGPIAAQQEISFPEGVTAIEADQIAAGAGAQLLVEALEKSEIPRTPQPEVGASHQGAPTEADRTIPASWPARRAFNFLRGADAWAPFWIRLPDGEEIEVQEALGYEQDVSQGSAYQEKGRELWVQMADGVIKVTRHPH